MGANTLTATPLCISTKQTWIDKADQTKQAILLYCPLLHRRRIVVAKAPDTHSQWCNTFRVDTAGQKLDIALKGKQVGT